MIKWGNNNWFSEWEIVSEWVDEIVSEWDYKQLDEIVSEL